MKQLFIEREPSTKVETMGRLSWFEEDGVVQLYCVEQEWRPTAPGGEPRNSCVPPGTYALIPHTRGTGRKTLALVNHGLGVYYLAGERISGVGRYMILIHAGNTHKDVVGCIAPGTGRTNQMVTHSRDAMKRIMNYIDGHEAELIIT